MSIEQQDEQQIVQEIVGQVVNVTLDDGNVNDEPDHRNNSSSNIDESIALEVSHLNACDVSTDYTTDSEEANNKKDESLHSPKEEKKQMTMMEGNIEVQAVTTTTTNDGVGEESDLPFNSTAGQNGGSALEVSNLLDVSATDSEESTKTAIPPTPRGEEKQQKDISMMEGENGVPAMISESGGGESDLALNSTAGQNDNKDDGTNNNDDGMDSDTAANGGGDEEDKEVEPKHQPPQKTNKTKMCSVL